MTYHELKNNYWHCWLLLPPLLNRCSSIFTIFGIACVSRFDMLGEPGDATRVNLPHKEVSTLGMVGNWPGTAAASHERR